MSAPITVVGSLNMDFVVQVAALPRPGETVLGGGFATLPGGKGANQACAAAKLGGLVRMVGRVGDDVLGRALRQSLASAGVDTTAVLTTEGTPSGVALICVQAGGQNQIVVAPGAGGLLSAGDVAHALGGAASGLLLLQLESPLETVERAVALGRERGLTILLDPGASSAAVPAVAGGRLVPHAERERGIDAAGEARRNGSRWRTRPKWPVRFAPAGRGR